MPRKRSTEPAATAALRATPSRARAQPAASDSAAEARVHHAILETVLAHRLHPGTRLVEARLCEAFAVKRSLLRRVFVRLASEKVIELHHNRGATVARPSTQEMREVFEARQLIEGGVMRALEGRVDSAGIGLLRQLVLEEKAAYDRGAWSAWVRLSGEYHLHLVRLLGNPEIETILRGLVARTTLMKALYHSHGGNVCSFDEHNEILDAMESADMGRACSLMHAHLHGAQSQLRHDRAPANIDLLALFRPG